MRNQDEFQKTEGIAMLYQQKLGVWVIEWVFNILGKRKMSSWSVKEERPLWFFVKKAIQICQYDTIFPFLHQF